MSRVPLFSWSALVASIGLLLTLPVVLGVLVYLIVDHRYSRALFGGNTGVASWLGFALTQPATYLFALPAIGLAAELVSVTFRTRQPMRGVMFAGLGLVGVAALSAVTQQANFTVPWEGSGINLEGFGDKISDLLPYAFFTLLPLLGALIVMAVGALAAKPGPDEHAAAHHGGVRVLLLRPRDGVRRHVRRRPLAVRRPRAAGHRLRRRCVRLRRVRRRAGRPRRARLLGAEVDRSPRARGSGARAGRCSASSPRSSPPCRTTSPGSPTSRRSSDVYDYDGPSALWNLAVTVGHALMALVVVAYLGLLARSARNGEPAADDPWHGQTLEWLTTSPAPDANFVETPTVMSPEPALDLRAAPPGSDR